MRRLAPEPEPDPELASEEEAFLGATGAWMVRGEDQRAALTTGKGNWTHHFARLWLLLGFLLTGRIALTGMIESVVCETDTLLLELGR